MDIPSDGRGSDIVSKLSQLFGDDKIKNQKEQSIHDKNATEQHEDRANDLVLFRCCIKNCLLKRNLRTSELIMLYRGCKEEVEKFRCAKDRKDYLRDKIRGFEITVTAGGRYKIKYDVGVKPGVVVGDVCKVLFQKLYSVGHTYVDEIIFEIKNNVVRSGAPFSDQTNHARHNPLKSTKSLGELNNVQKKNADGTVPIISNFHLAMASIPNSPAVLLCYDFLDHLFKLIGDFTPNQTEIHLEPQYKTELYDEYKKTICNGGMTLGVDDFYRIWRDQFPYVKIREYKAVCGKCGCCGKLSACRQKYRDEKEREIVRALHQFHRMTYMGERASYAAHVNLAYTDKNNFFSCVSDGMAQAHMLLPWFGNRDEPPVTLNHKMIGVLCHNRRFFGFRTYHNVQSTTNLTIHCWLLALEAEYKANNGSLPSTVFYQMDGGPDNANRHVLAIAELLVARRLTRKVVVSRLLVGHSHCDLDAIFGILWRAVWKQIVSYPQQYEKIIRKALKSFKIDVYVEDIFVVPDYMEYLKPFEDNIQRAFKEEWTQLRWTFEAVDFCEGCCGDVKCDSCDRLFTQFPTGVKVTYRAYAQDEVYEIVEKESSESRVGLEAILTLVRDYPAGDVGSGALPGMHILNSLPEEDRAFTPAPFLDYSKETLDNVVEKLKEEFGAYNKHAINMWKLFQSKCPTDNDAQRFISEYPEQFKIPFQDVLFRNANIDRKLFIKPKKPHLRSGLRTVIAMPTVKWRNNNIPTVFPNNPRMEISDFHRSSEKEAQSQVNSMCDQPSDMQIKNKELEVQLRTKGLPIGGNKAEKVARLQANTDKEKMVSLRGYSSCRKIFVMLHCSLSGKSWKGFHKFFHNIAEQDDQVKRSEIIKEAITSSNHFGLKLYHQKDRTYYEVTKPDGSCTFALITVMTERAMRPISERDSFASYPELNFKDVERKKSVIRQLRDTMNRQKKKMEKFDKDILEEMRASLNRYIRHWENNGDGMIPRDYWIGTRQLPFWLRNDFPISIFTDKDIVDENYVRLYYDTRYPDRSDIFEYNELLNLLDNPNLSAIYNDHSFPLPSSLPLSGLFLEAVEDLISQLSELSPLVWTMLKSKDKKESDEQKNAVIDFTAKVKERKENVKPKKRRDDINEEESIVSDSDESEEVLLSSSSTLVHRPRRVQRRAAVIAKNVIGRGGEPSTDYHQTPDILYNERIRRMMKNEKNEDELFWGEVVAGGYDVKRKTWKIFYKELDWEERLSIHDILKGLEEYGNHDRK